MHSRIWTDSDLPIRISSHFESMGAIGAEGAVERASGVILEEFRTPQARRSVSVSRLDLSSSFVVIVGVILKDERNRIWFRSFFLKHSFLIRQISVWWSSTPAASQYP